MRYPITLYPTDTLNITAPNCRTSYFIGERLTVGSYDELLVLLRIFRFRDGGWIIPRDIESAFKGVLNARTAGD